MKIAVFPGSFDPITTGHIDIVKRAIPLFDKIILAIGVNSVKSSLFSLEQRRGRGNKELSLFLDLFDILFFSCWEAFFR